MNTLKYIKFDGSLADTVYLFPKWETHAVVAEAIGYPVLSAGFVLIEIQNNELLVTPYGRSESLRIGSDPADAVLIKRMLTTV